MRTGLKWAAAVFAAFFCFGAGCAAAQTAGEPAPSAWVGKLATETPDGASRTLLDNPWFDAAFLNEDAKSHPLPGGGFARFTPTSPKLHDEVYNCTWYGARGLSLTLPRSGGRKQDYVFFNAACANPGAIVAFMIPAFDLNAAPEGADMTVYYCRDDGAQVKHKAHTIARVGGVYQAERDHIRTDYVVRKMQDNMCGRDPISDKAQILLDYMYASPAELRGEAVAPVAAAPAATTATTGGGPVQSQSVDLDAILDDIIKADSQSWLFWRYDYGTARNAKVEQTLASGEAVVYGEYTFNGGSRGWVRVRLSQDGVKCIEFWNEGRCRPFRSPPSHGIVTGLIAGAAAGASSGGGYSSGDYGSCASQCSSAGAADPVADAALRDKCMRQCQGRAN